VKTHVISFYFIILFNTFIVNNFAPTSLIHHALIHKTGFIYTFFI